MFSIKVHTTKVAKISDFFLKLIEKVKIRDFCDARIRNIVSMNHKNAYAFYIVLGCVVFGCTVIEINDNVNNCIFVKNMNNE